MPTFAEKDIAELRTAEDKPYLFVAIDRTSKFAVARLVDKANRKTACELLELLLDVFVGARHRRRLARPSSSYRIHTILTDNVN